MEWIQLVKPFAPAFLGLGALLELLGVGLVASPFMNRLGLNFVQGLSHIPSDVARIARHIWHVLHRNKRGKVVAVSTSVGADAAVSTMGTRTWRLTGSVNENLEEVERALNDIPGKMEKQWRSEYQVEANNQLLEVQQRYFVPLKSDVDDVARYPKLRGSGVIFLFIGVILTMVGSLLSLGI